MLPELLTKKELSSLLGMCPRSARSFCERYGVYPINVGNGKIVRLRWRRFDVMRLLDTVKPIRSQSDIRKQTRRKADTSFFTMPVNEFLSALQ